VNTNTTVVCKTSVSMYNTILY